MENTIYETFTLPSKGLMYDKPINPTISLRSMTTIEEMQRLSQTDTPYKVMADIIETCMKEKPDIHVYNMCMCDYQYLLHKLRIVTYGNDYKISIRCVKCGEVSDSVGKLDSLKINPYTDDIVNDKFITLPVTNHEIELRYKTPKDFDMIDLKASEMKKKTKLNLDYKLMYSLIAAIKKVDGKALSFLEIEEFVKTLPMNDSNFILYKSNELDGKVGLDTLITVKCGLCGEESTTTFRYSPEFFGPTNY